jgi:hypothetical protein
MGVAIGFVDNTGAYANQNLLAAIKTLAEANGWTTLRYDTVSAIRELILQSSGLSGAEDIYIGFRSYQNVGADVYNVSVAGFTGYVPGNTFITQPGYFESGIPAHNNRIDYWMAANAQRIVFGLKVGTPVYTHGYAGKFFPYGTPSQYPYPLYVGGCLSGIPETRYSATTYSMPYYGATAGTEPGTNRPQSQLRFVDGSWRQHRVWPYYGNAIVAQGTAALRETGAQYSLQPIILMTSSPTLNLLGELDGVYQITGFNNVTENTLVIDGEDYVVLQDASLTGFNNYIALRME